MAEKTALEQILIKEDVLLDKILAQQTALRGAVRDKKWERLMETISAVNALADEFKDTESERERIALQSDPDEQKAVMPLLAQVRGKLVKSQTENKALGDYITITRGFIQGVLDEAVPQSRSKVYSRNGKIVHSSPSSVVVNALY